MIADKNFDYITDNHYVTAYVDYTDGAMIVVCNACDTKKVVTSDNLKKLVNLIEDDFVNPFYNWEDGQGDILACLCPEVVIKVSEDDLPF